MGWWVGGMPATFNGYIAKMLVRESMKQQIHLTQTRVAMVVEAQGGATWWYKYLKCYE